MKRLLIVCVVGALAVAGCIGREAKPSAAAMSAPAAASDLAACVAEKGYVVYGTAWCRYCRMQKRFLFGDETVVRPPYVECQDRNGKPLGTACDGKPIQGWPTWVGPDGRPTEANGALTPERLSELTGCRL